MMIVTSPAAITAQSIEAISEVALRRLWRFCAEHVLGTRLEVLVQAHSHASAAAAAEVAQAEIERLNRVLNHRRSDTEISELLRARRATVSADLFSVLQLSETWRDLSRGAFDGRMGALLPLWATAAEPDQLTIETALAAARDSTVTLDPDRRWVELSPGTTLQLDAVAKGYIVDAALEAARRAVPTLEGIAINVGGDIRCWGQSPRPCGWRIGIPDPAIPAENAPLIDVVALRNSAIATSGIGPRDRLRDGYRSTTISPFNGRPVRKVISASVVASHAADADAIATACMVLHPDDSIALADKLDGVAARITEADGRVHASKRWPALQLAQAAQGTQAAAVIPKGAAQPLPPELRWPSYWELAIVYTEADFKATDAREPYIAVWITDAQNKPVTTLLLLGKDTRWVRENFIWWNSWNERAQHEAETRSKPTTSSGQYVLEWLGVDDDLNPVPIGKYILHFETSREHGKHTYRSLPIEIGREQFKTTFEDLDGMGSMHLAYKPYLDRPADGY